MDVALDTLATKYKKVDTNTVKIHYKQISKTQKLRGLVATSDIPKGVLIATYPVVAMSWKKASDLQNDYILTIHDTTTDGPIKSELVGVPTEQTLRLETMDWLGLPPIGMFVNEPLTGSANCEIIFPAVFPNEIKSLKGRVLYGFIRTTSNIKKGKELHVCYAAQGETHYHRDYKTSCA